MVWRSTKVPRCNVTCKVILPTLRISHNHHGGSRSMFRMPRLHRRQRSRGQGIVEFALILPVLILMLLITLDFGRLFMSYITLTNTTRVAANYGSVNPGMFTGTPNTTTYNAVVARESAGLNCALKPDAGGNNPPIPTFPGALGFGSGRYQPGGDDLQVLAAHAVHDQLLRRPAPDLGQGRVPDPDRRRRQHQRDDDAAAARIADRRVQILGCHRRERSMAPGMCPVSDRSP